MPVLEYLDFDVAVERTGEGYRARVFGSPAGEGSAGVILPFDETQVKDVLLRVQDAREDLTGAAAIREATLDGIRSFGATLFESAFRDVVGALLGASLASATSQGKGLRIRLRLDPALSEVPWEYLYNRPLDRFLCLSAETPVVRYLEVPEPVSAAKVERPLRVLVMISDPADYPALDVEGEWARLTGALDELIREGLVAVDRLDDASLPALHERLTASPYHAFHFIGHGGFDPRDEDGLLLLEGPGGAGTVVPGADLATALLDARLRLAVLNTCEGARTSARDPFAGTAQALVRQGIPAVVAMQFEITDDAARDLSQQFYGALAMGFPVDAALAEARKSVYFTGNRVEWATPVLYMRSPNGRIFDVEGTGRLVAPRAEVDPLAPAGRDRTTPPLVVHAGELAIGLEDPAGALITATQPETRPVPRLRRPPVDLRPKDLPGLVGREAEVRAMAETFLNDRSRPPIEVTGQDGAGKTALLRNVAHHPSAQFRDGAVYSSSPQPIPDLLQFLFQTFYESAAPVKPTEAELRIHLHQVQALVELDDVNLSREELQLLGNVAPNVQLLLASRERLLWEDGPSFSLRGLSEEAAVRLFERRIGRVLSHEERSSALALSRALGGLPLALIKAAARVRDEGLSLEQLSREAAPPAPAPAEERVASVLEAVAAPVDEDLLAAATAVPDLSTLRLLEERGVLQSHSPRYSLAEPRPDAGETGNDISWRAEALATMVEWAEANEEDPYRILEEIDALLGMLRWAQQHQRWDQVVRLGRAIERALALAGRWSRWEEVLEAVLNAARVSEDANQEAWALHQLGSRAIGLDEADVARPLLLQALSIRERIGDAHGAELTRQNLGFAGGAPVGGPGGGGPGPAPRWWLRILVAIGVGGLVGGGVAAFLATRDEPVPTAAFEVEPGSLDFGSQEERSTSPALTLTVTGVGERASSVRVGEPRGRDRADFEVVTDTCSGIQLAREQACSIRVVFRPSSPGDREGTLVLRNTTTDTPVRVPLRGTGVSGEGIREPLPEISIDPDVIDPFEEDGETRAITITNTGDGELELEPVIDPGEDEFIIDEKSTTCPGVLAGQAECTIVVRFHRTPFGTGEGDLLIVHNVGDGEPITLSLSGVPRPVASPPELTLDSSTGTVTVRNVGTAQFEFLGANIEPADQVAFTIAENGCVSFLLIDQECSVTIERSPEVAAAQATLVLSTDRDLSLLVRLVAVRPEPH